MEINEHVSAYSNNDEDLILESIKETAKLLGISRTTVYELIWSGDLRSVHVGRRHLIPRGERLRFVRDQLENKQSPLKKFQELQHTEELKNEPRN